VLKFHWHSREPAHRIANDLGIKTSELEREWRRLKLDHVIPNQQRRIGVGPAVAPISIDHMDGRPAVGVEDRLLAKLREKHPERSMV